MSKFFDLFPKLIYDIDGKQYTNYHLTTNIFFRMRLVREVLKNLTAYYEHTIRDGDTPEILADRVYSDPEAHWVILLANDIVDPQADWPLATRELNKYIANKYKYPAAVALSISTDAITDTQVLSWTKSNYHHYEKVIQRTESLTNYTTEIRLTIDQAKLTTNTSLTAPHDTYQTLPLTSNNTINMGTGTTVYEEISKDRITYYDYEIQQNDNKRLIKVIKPEYYGRIVNEFNNLTENTTRAPFIRRLV